MLHTLEWKLLNPQEPEPGGLIWNRLKDKLTSGRTSQKMMNGFAATHSSAQWFRFAAHAILINPNLEEAYFRRALNGTLNAVGIQYLNEYIGFDDAGQEIRYNYMHGVVDTEILLRINPNYHAAELLQGILMFDLIKNGPDENSKEGFSLARHLITESLNKGGISPGLLSKGKDRLQQIEFIFNRPLRDITDNTIRSIHNGRVIIFCGAGISANSGLPLATPFTESILVELNASKYEIDRIRKATLPFESFMRTLQDNSSIEIFLDIFDRGEPNLNHLLIANLMITGRIRVVVTTNFDRLFEQALLKKGWIENKEYIVYYREEDYHKIDWQDGRPKLIKLHGSVHDKKGMAITMQQVAGKKYSEPRKEIIDQVFGSGKHEYVLVIGYSSSDSFDILPYIRAIKKGHRKVVIIEHNANVADIKRIEDIRLSSQNNPFIGFTDSYRLYRNTDALVREIWEANLGVPIENAPVKGNNLWLEHIRKWHSALNSKAAEHLIVGLILMDINENAAAAQRYELAINASHIARDKKREAFSLSLLGNITNSMTHLEQALIISREIDDKNQQANCLCGLAPIYYGKNQIEKAIKCCEEGLYIARVIDDKSREGRLLGNLGSINGSLNKFDSAVEYFEAARRISQEIGDKAEEGAALFNIGLAYKNMNKLADAKEYYEQSLQALIPFLGGEHPVVKNVNRYLAGLGAV